MPVTPEAAGSSPVAPASFSSISSYLTTLAEGASLSRAQVAVSSAHSCGLAHGGVEPPEFGDDSVAEGPRFDDIVDLLSPQRAHRFLGCRLAFPFDVLVGVLTEPADERRAFASGERQ